MLFRSMLEDCSHEDLEIARDIVKDSTLAAPFRRILPSNLHESASVMRGAALLSTRSAGGELGPSAVISRRFGIWQNLGNAGQ